MGCGMSRSARQAQATELEKYATVTPDDDAKASSATNGPARGREVKSPEEAVTAKDIRKASELLRNMYALDLEIWGMEHCHESEVPRREDMKRRADAILAELRRTVALWLDKEDNFTEEEEMVVEQIVVAVEKQPGGRYFDA